MADESKMMKLLEDVAADAKKAAEASQESRAMASRASANSELAYKEAQRANRRLSHVEASVEHIDKRVSVLEGHDLKSAKSLAEEAKLAAEEAKRISQAEGLEADAHKADTLVKLSRLELALTESAKSLEAAKAEFRAQKRSRRTVNLASVGAFVSSLTAAIVAVIYALRAPVPAPAAPAMLGPAPLAPAMLGPAPLAPAMLGPAPLAPASAPVVEFVDAGKR